MLGKMEMKTVLVKLKTDCGLRNRPVSFCGGKDELLDATKVRFDDLLDGNDIYLQILDESWGDGVFVDLLDQDIPPRSIILAVEKVSY